MKKVLTLLAMTALLIMAAGCEKEEFAEPPVYGKIYCTTAHPKVGDTVTLKIEIVHPGNRLNSAEYRWKIKEGSTWVGEKTVKVLRQSGKKSITAAPTIDWVFKESGKYNITMTAYFSYTMGDVNSVMKGNGAASGQVQIFYE